MRKASALVALVALAGAALLLARFVQADTVGSPIPVGVSPVQEQLSPDGTKLYVSDEGTGVGSCVTPPGPSTVSIIDATTDSFVKNISVGVDPGPIRFSPDGKKAYVVNQSDCDPTGSVSVIDVASGTEDTRVTVGKLPVTLSVSKDGSKVYVANKGASSNSISVLCTGLLVTPACPAMAANTVIKSINLSLPDADSGVSTGGNTSNTLNDTTKSWATNAFAGAAIKITDGTGMGQSRNISSNTATQIVVSANWTTIPDATSQYALNKTPGIQPHVLAKNPSGNELWVAEQDCAGVFGCTSGNLVVVSTASDSVTHNIAVGPTPGSIHFTPDGSRSYVASRGNGALGIPPTVADINTGTYTVTGALIPIIPSGFPTDASPHSLRVTPDGGKVYVADRHSNDVAVICTGMVPAACSGSDTVVTYIPVGTSPSRLELMEDGSRAYVVNEGSSNVSVICTGLVPVNCGGFGSDTVMATLTVGATPVDIEIRCQGPKAYVSNFGADSVSVINISGVSPCTTATPTPTATPPPGPNTDSDGDGYTDVAEAGAPLCNNAVNDDNMDDSVVNDGCPGGPPQAGSFSEAQFHIGSNPLGRCGVGAEPGPSADWPADFASGGVPNSTDKINLLDLTSFLAPVRHINTSPGHPSFSQRWDIVPGRGAFTQWINIQDLSNLITLKPPMSPFSGTTRAFNGPACTNP